MFSPKMTSSTACSVPPRSRCFLGRCRSVKRHLASTCSLRQSSAGRARTPLPASSARQPAVRPSSSAVPTRPLRRNESSASGTGILVSHFPTGIPRKWEWTWCSSGTEMGCTRELNKKNSQTFILCCVRAVNCPSLTLRSKPCNRDH